uniref:Dermaseptin-J5 n=1 Tax=Phasmahyla jandaia TaxID=762504 RepID=DMS5_PHAJA|nr:RecName: Full=Dermaseptin-J5; Short=DRS-J5 [Phasmahyla jandaia]
GLWSKIKEAGKAAVKAAGKAALGAVANSV